MSIIELLNLERFPDLARLRDGYVVIHEPEKGQSLYKLDVNDPLSPESIEKIVVFGEGADPALIRRLYQLCNGLRVAKLGIYGLLSGPWGAAQPWDINVPNLYGRPEGFPENFLIVGTNREKDKEGQTLKLSHCITADGRVVVVELEKPDVIWREYCSIDEWLQTEVERALAT